MISSARYALVHRTFISRGGGGGRGLSKQIRKLNWKSTDKRVTAETAAALFRSSSLLNNMSHLLPGDERIRASAFEMELGEELETPRTFYEALQVGAAANTVTKNICGWIDPCTKKLKYLTYDQFFTEAKQISMALYELGTRPRDFVALNFINSKDFLMSIYGVTAMSMILQPLYPSLSAPAIRSVLRQGRPKIYMVDTEEKARGVVEKASKLSFVKALVVSGPEPSRDLRNDAKAANLQLISMKDFKKIGENKSYDLQLPSQDDIFGLIYTSGTTGNPKGAIITHGRLMRVFHSMQPLVQSVSSGVGEYMFSFLPTGHIYELLFEVLCLGNGGTVMFWRGNIRDFPEDLKIIRPHTIPMVPRVMNRIYDKVHKLLEGNYIKRKIFEFAYRRKKALLLEGDDRETIYDKFVFREVRDTLGGRVKLIVSASAPLSPRVLEFYKVACGCAVVEVYGSTEAMIVTVTSPYDYTGGHLGGPVPLVEVKLVDVPELGFFTKNDIGEIYVRSPFVFTSYHNNESATHDAIKDGWLATGDIGKWTPEGKLIIVDRQKDIFKLSHGEYITPERVESIYSRLPYVQEVFVEGSSERSFCVAIVVPAEQSFIDWAKQKGLVQNHPPVYTQICQDVRVRKALLKDFRETGKAYGLTEFEQIRNLFIEPELFTITNGMLASTYKVKRNFGRKKYAQVIEEMYREGPLLDN